MCLLMLNLDQEREESNVCKCSLNGGIYVVSVTIFKMVI